MTNPDDTLETPRGLAERLSASLGDRFRVERELGGGGMSRVFVAYEPALDRRVVIKVLPEELATTMSRERFRREVLTSANLQHPNIVGVIAAGDADGLLYFVMPFVEGESLRARLTRDGALSPAMVVHILRDVARALAFAHQRGVVHRDIKPENILLSGGTAVVADFGVARALASARASTTNPGTATSLTGVGVSLGTPAYMAPEQIAGEEDIDGRTDIYALGVTAFEALCGRPPFVRATISDLLRAHLAEAPAAPSTVRPTIPAALDEIVLRCLAKERERRPQSANELLALLENPAVVSGAITSPSLEVQRPTTVRSRVLAGVVVAAVAVAAAIGGTLWAGRTPATPAVAAKPAVPPTPTVAVLPLVAASSDSADRYLAFGLTDEIIGALARIRGVRVASRSAAEAAQNEGGSINELSQRLGAGYLLEGTVQRQGKALRVAVRLVSGADGFTTWSDVYDGSVDDLLEVERHIATEIAAAVTTDLAGGDSTSAAAVAAAAVAAKHEPPPAAYDAFLRGHFELSRRGASSTHRAIAELRRAVKADTLYAAAWAELAQALTLLPLYDDVDEAPLHAEAVLAAQRALALDSTLASAHAALGNIYNGEWRWQDGARELERAVALDSAYAGAHQWLGENRLLNGDAAGAARALGQAARLDSSNTMVRAVQGLALALAGDTAAGSRTLRDAVESDPSIPAAHVMRATAMLYAGQSREAVRELEIARTLAPSSPLVLGTLGYALGAAGRRPEAEAVATRLRQASRTPGARSALAKVQLALGDTAAALGSLEQALRDRDPIFRSEPLSSPIYDAVRASGRFAAIVRGAGLDTARVLHPVRATR